MGSRRQARELALKLLFQLEAAGFPEGDDAVARFWDDNAADADVEYYASLVAKLVIENREEVDGLIRAAAANWEFSRIAPAERNLLRVAAAEILYVEDVPPRVAINEAIELAKVYGTGPRAAAFVNGILDALYNRRRSAPPAPVKAAPE